MSPVIHWAYRVAIMIYISTFAMLIVANIPSVAAAVLELENLAPWTRILFGLMGVITAVTFFALSVHCLYHWGRQPTEGFNKTGWFLVLLLLNFVGIVVYYFRVIEREQRPPREAARVAFP